MSDNGNPRYTSDEIRRDPALRRRKNEGIWQHKKRLARMKKEEVARLVLQDIASRTLAAMITTTSAADDETSTSRTSSDDSTVGRARAG